MNIGIDFDDTLVDSRSTYLKYFPIWNEKYHCDSFDNMPQTMRDIFFKEMWNSLYEEISWKAGAIEALKELQANGYKLFIISARYGKCIEYTKDVLNKTGIIFENMVFESHIKSIPCKELKIDLMIDDNDNNIAELKQNGVKCIHFGKSYRFKHIDNWPDMVTYILERKKHENN